jgi:uncharacterized protein YkwD
VAKQSRLQRWIDMLFGQWKLVIPDPPTPDPLPIPGNAVGLLAEINRFRVRNSMPALIESACFTRQAESHVSKMSGSGKLSHDGWTQRLQSCGISRGSENVAHGQRNAQECVEDWARSPGHRANMLGDWDECGVAEKSGYWCAIFAEAGR